MKKIAVILGCFLAGVSLLAQTSDTARSGVPGVASGRGEVNMLQLSRRSNPGSEAQTHKKIVRHRRTSEVTTSASAAIADPAETSGIGVPSPAPTTNFLGLNDNGFAIPPDTMGAVGPNHVMVTANTQVRIMDRSGNALSTVSLDSFWSSLSGVTEVFDPKLHYDPYANRWIFVACANPESATSSILVGVTTNSDPTTTWSLYKIDADAANTLWADYPSVGFNKDLIVITVNMFDNVFDQFNYSAIFALNKTNFYARGTGSFTRFTDDTGFTFAPAVTYDPNLNVEYLMDSYAASSGSVRISRLTGAPTAPSLQIGYGYATGSPWRGFTFSGNFLPQLGTSAGIDAGDDRMLKCVFRNGSLWASHTVFLPANFPTRAAAQWWQVTTNGAVQQVGRVEDATGVNHFAFPTLAVNQNGDVLMGYSRASSSQYISANYSFRYANDAPNTMRDDTVFKAGEGCYVKTFGSGENRWGDYSSTVVDPVNDLSMWTLQEYAAAPSGGCFDGSGNWGLWWARVDAVLNTGLSATAGLAGESCTPTNGFVDPGETITLKVTLRNSGQIDLTNVTATLLATNGVFSPSMPQSYGTLSVSGPSVFKTFTYTAGGICGGFITNVVAIQANGTNAGNVSFVFPLGGQVTRVNQNFDSVTPPALPTNWTVVFSGPAGWVTTSAVFSSASNSVFASDPATVSDAALVSPLFAISATNAQLSFAHRYNTEYGFDGGVLEMSINEGPFTDILAAGGRFQANGYNFSIDEGFGSPIAGRNAWTGDSGSNFITTVVTLPQTAANTSVRLRWRLASDGTLAGNGWYVDSVVLTDRTCCRPAAPLILNLRRQGNQIVFAYNSKLGIYYLLEGRASLTSPWVPVSTDLGNGTQRWVTNTITGTEKYFRLHEL